jgi:hypothetical protein
VKRVVGRDGEPASHFFCSDRKSVPFRGFKGFGFQKVLTGMICGSRL